MVRAGIVIDHHLRQIAQSPGGVTESGREDRTKDPETDLEHREEIEIATGIARAATIITMKHDLIV